MGKSWQKQQESVYKEQSNKSYDQIKAEMQQKSEFMVELDNLPKQNHSWTHRGLKATCENAGHNYHEFWFRRRVF